MNYRINQKLLLAYSVCPLKAYLLLLAEQRDLTHPYSAIIEQRKITNQTQYIEAIAVPNSEVRVYSAEHFPCASKTLTNAKLVIDRFEAEFGLLTVAKGDLTPGKYNHFEPTIFSGLYTITHEHKLELYFVAYVLAKVQRVVPEQGTIITMRGKPHIFRLRRDDFKKLENLIRSLEEWVAASNLELPPLILSKHCAYCQFQSLCNARALEEDNLSLLDGISSIQKIKKYHAKGIFTTKQLSYLFRPRRRSKKAKRSAVTHRPELQALAIRTGNTYVQQLPILTTRPAEIFLDFEGIPDQDFYYLIGMLICKGDACGYHHYWANSPQDEARIWSEFLQNINQYASSEMSLYHYGSYEPRAIHKLGRRYDGNILDVKNRLVNVNSSIYGRLYFPTRSNALKEIGKLLGASWTSPDASGLQSIVWRYLWEDTSDSKYQELLITYNREDCLALKLLVNELNKIQNSAESLSYIDFLDKPKRHATEIGKQLHNDLETILAFGHAEYDKKKISLKQAQQKFSPVLKKRGAKVGHKAYHKLIPKAGRTIRVPRRRRCYRHGLELVVSQDMAERTIIDLVFTQSGVRKTVTRYYGLKSYCPKCSRSFAPNAIVKLGNRVFGHSFQAWVVYQRLFLRLPYRVITQVVEDHFRETITAGTIPNFFRYLTQYYAGTEKQLLQRILESPFVHVDETKINIQGTDQFVWVFTDGRHVVFRLTETREATLVHKILSGYQGVLISDFYGGYDAVKCRQQKCWSHLIGDLNDDLWKEPFNDEFQTLVLAVRNLIVPILEETRCQSPKKKRLASFRKSVDQFYENIIIDKPYSSELVQKYQKRFLRYRDSLFIFLECDGIPWNNNMAERALRHLAVQRKISGAFYESAIENYLLLLGIMQSCRFQGKPLLQYLLSGERDVDKYKPPRAIRRSVSKT